MEGWMWLVLASMFGVGGAFGYILGRARGDNHHKIRELETSLSESATELESYRAEVAQHFGKTAELFNKLTTDYKEVYEHLAASSEALCGDRATKLNAKVPDQSLLDATHSKPGAKAEPAQEAPEEKTASTVEDSSAEETKTEASAKEEKASH